MKIVKSLLTKNPCYTANKKITVKGLMLHSVGCPQPKASVFINTWNNPSYKRACVHGFIDGNDGVIYQTLEWNHRGWHSAKGTKGSANDTHIGVEMCEPAYIKYTGGSTFTMTDKVKAQECVKRTYNSAVELFAYLCEEYNLNPMTDIISHSEGYKMGVASNHGDPEHLWKGVGLHYTMDSFRQDVKNKMNVVVEEKPTQKPFIVKVTISNLNIRKGAGLSYGKNGVCPKGLYTIVETKTKDGYEWGKLKSGVGWIALKYTERI